jgi:hypothetical protein
VSGLSLDEYVAHARLHFEEGLIAHSYRETDDGWEGSVSHKSGPSLVRVVIPDTFPFSPPRVTPVDLDWAAWSWHRELDGALCLVAQDDHTDLWWSDAAAFLSHVEAWFVQADLNWPDDRTDLDLERYFPSSADRRLVVYGDLQPLDQAYVRFRAKAHNVLELTGRGTRPAKARSANRDRWGYVAALGELTSPPRTWADVRELIGLEAGDRVERGTVDTLVLTYLRGQHEGAAVFDLLLTTNGLVLHRLRSGPDTAESTSARSGRSADVLASKHVAIVGTGAIGSFLADALVRAGVGRLTLVDNDLIKPGNLVRHLAGPDAVGMTKPLAVRSELVRRFRLDPRLIEVVEEDACDPTLMSRLVKDCDVVINATADFSVTALVQAAATYAGAHSLSICIQNAGLTLRLDVLPPISGLPLPNSARPGEDASDYFEAGCGSPISPTPPPAVIEAAAVAARHAIGYLIGMPLDPAGEVREMTVVQQ